MPQNLFQSPVLRCVAIVVTVLAGFAIAPAYAQDDNAFTEEEFSGWLVRCLEDKQECTAFTKSQGAQLIVALNNNKEDVPVRVALHIPPGAGKGEPVALYLDSDVTFQVRTWNCTDRYCEGQVATEATTAVLTRLIADTKGLIIYRLEKDIHLVPITLSKFNEAWKFARK